MATVQGELQRKFDVTPDMAVTGLETLPGIAAVSPAQEVQLNADYYDTATHSLLGSGVTLRRNIGDRGDGWTLMIPVSKNERLELSAPAAADSHQVPAELMDRARAWVRDHEVRMVANIRTRRTTWWLLGSEDQTLAQVSDDSVISSAPDPRGDTLVGWREWVVEIVDGSDALLRATGRLMLDLGAIPSGRSAKLRRALGERRSPADSAANLSPRSQAGHVVQAYLHAEITALMGNDHGVRNDQHDAVHKVRVACRRLRTALSTFGPLVDREITDPIRDELKELATILGVARDAEVQRARFDRAIDAEPADLVTGEIEEWINLNLAAQYNRGHAEALRALNSKRYFRLLDRLDALAVSPPFTELADEPAGPVLTKRVRRAYTRLADDVAAARAADSPEVRDDLMHEARKLAKRLRYAAEAVIPAFGKPAADLAAAAGAVQEILGEHQDSVVARQVLREMAARAFLDGHDTFSFGRLHALEQGRAERAERKFDGIWKHGSNEKLRRWLR